MIAPITDEQVATLIEWHRSVFENLTAGALEELRNLRAMRRSVMEWCDVHAGDDAACEVRARLENKEPKS